MRALRHIHCQLGILYQASVLIRHFVMGVHLLDIDLAVQGLNGEEMWASEHYYWRLIQIDAGVGLEHYHVWFGVQIHTALLTVVMRALFAAYAWTLMATSEELGATLVAW